MDKKEISIVLGTYNRKRFLRAAIESIRDNGIMVPYEIIVVDGGSSDGTLRWLARQKDVIAIIQHNRGSVRGQAIRRRSWGYFMNLGFKCAQGNFVLMISDDCLLVPGAVMNGLNRFKGLLAQGRSVAAVAFYWRNWPTAQEYWVGLTFGNKMFVNHGMYLSSALQEVDWIDEERYQFYHADGDLCLRLWQEGYEVVDCPGAYVEHFAHANYRVRQSNLLSQGADWQAYQDRWSGIYSADSGGWICRSYDDPYRTAERFPTGDRALLRLMNITERPRRRLISTMRLLIRRENNELPSR